MGWDGTGWDGTGWDGTGRDGTGQGRMGSDTTSASKGGIGWDADYALALRTSVCSTTSPRKLVASSYFCSCGVGSHSVGSEAAGRPEGSGYPSGGIWRDGIWRGATRRGGIWRDGIWRAATRHGWIWRGGIWRGATRRGGIWRDGIWLGLGSHLLLGRGGRFRVRFAHVPHLTLLTYPPLPARVVVLSGLAVILPALAFIRQAVVEAPC